LFVLLFSEIHAVLQMSSEDGLRYSHEPENIPTG